MNQNAGMCTCKDLVKKYTLHLYCVFLAIRICIFLRLNHGIFKSSPFSIPFFLDATIISAPRLKVSGCGVVALWKLDVEKVHVAKASSTDGHRVWLLLRWGVMAEGR